MNSVAIIIPYFGKLPKNINSFLITCKFNSKIDWYIFTDQKVRKYIDLKLKNVFFIKTNFKNIKTRIIEVVGTQNIVLDKPYKLCDYRPLYGIVFQDFLRGYKYWGYSDIDVVYGDLWKFIRIGLEKQVDKIGHYGHFTLFKNTPEVNQRYKLSIKISGEKVTLFNIASSMKKAFHFDEADGINRIYDYYKFSVYDNRDLVNEPYPENMDLVSMDKRFFRLPNIYVWKNGKCLFFYKKNKQILCKEFGYFHFQKRRFNCQLNSLIVHQFYVDTYGYHKFNTFNKKIIGNLMCKNMHSFSMRLKYLLYSLFKTPYYTSRKIGDIRLPIMHVLIRIFIKKDFFI